MKNYSFLILIILILIILILYNSNQFNTWLLNRLLVARGILAPNCTWYTISDLLLSNDGAGINLYYKLKQKYGAFAPTYMFGKKIYVVTNNKYMQIILDNSPDIFSVGTLKYTFFKSFMEKNVGVSKGCPWKQRRHMNEVALTTDKLHIYAKKYNNDIQNQLITWRNKSELIYSDFLNFGKKMVARIVFNTNHINNDFFKIFSEANTNNVFSSANFKISPKIYTKYIKLLNHYINNPNPDSLIALLLKTSNDHEEILHQIPHFIFPIVGIFAIVIPRLLLILCNHPNIFKKVIQEIHSIKHQEINYYENIYKLTYLRKCILEILRLNNSVVTTFRTLEKDYTFDNKYSFKKGTQFLILNYPVLREKEYFKNPNKFIPSRWTPEMEKSYYNLTFNQGPQRCPGKELAIYLIQSFMYNFIQIGKTTSIKSKKINTEKISQIINPCTIKFYIKK